MAEKSFLLSKTFWANIISLATILIGTQGMLISPEEQGSLVAGVMAVVNIYLRFVTDTRIVVVKE